MRSIPILFLLLIIVSCTLNLTTEKKIKKFKTTQKIAFIKINKKIKKSLYGNGDYIYVLAENYVLIYQNKKLINKLGGMGFGNNNFISINDIALSSSGNLLVLDGLQKEIKIFDKKGNWLKTSVLSFTSFPTLFDLSKDDTVYLFDQDKSEILVTRELSEKYDFSFGKFDFQNPANMVINDNRLIINTKSKKTLIYDLLGQLTSVYNNVIQISSGTIFKYDNYIIYFNDKILMILSQPINYFSIKDDILILNTNNTTSINKIIYE